MEIEVAEALSLLMMRINSQLNDSVAFVRDRCSANDLHWFRRDPPTKVRRHQPPP